MTKEPQEGASFPGLEEAVDELGAAGELDERHEPQAESQPGHNPSGAASGARVGKGDGGAHVEREKSGEKREAALRGLAGYGDRGAERRPGDQLEQDQPEKDEPGPPKRSPGQGGRAEVAPPDDRGVVVGGGLNEPATGRVKPDGHGSRWPRA